MAQKKQMNIAFSELEIQLLDDLARLDQVSAARMVSDLIADGLKHRLLHESPVQFEQNQIVRMTSPNVIKFYLQFEEALCDRLGVLSGTGVVGKVPQYHFCQYPNTNYWKERGLAGFWTVLPKSVTIVDNGLKQ
jgi:hypothetical protein